MRYFIGFLVLIASLSASADSVFLGTLKTKTKTVEIYQVDGKPVYTVKEGDQVLADKVAVAELRQRFPELGRMFDRGVADDASLSRKLVEPDRSSLIN